MKKTIREIVVVLLILFAGLAAERILSFPGSLISMALFAVLLLTGVLKEEYFRGGVSDLILKNLSFFFLPPAVRVVESLDLLQGVWAKLFLIMIISNTLVMAVTGMVVQVLLKEDRHG